MRFTACVLLYGDHPELAERTLGSLRPFPLRVRIACNAVSAATHAVVRKLAAELQIEMLIATDANSFKYPMMRRLFYDLPLQTPYVMWFDDDSWILPTAPDNWLELVEQSLLASAMVGSIWQSWPINDALKEFYKQQPWYKGRPIPTRHPFITGGWWALRKHLLHDYNWPPEDMLHNGGDVALGVLLAQQGHNIRRFEKHLAINANETLQCSSAKRRGVQKQPPYGSPGWRRLVAELHGRPTTD